MIDLTAVSGNWLCEVDNDWIWQTFAGSDLHMLLAAYLLTL